MSTETISTTKKEREESFIKISKSLMETKDLGKNGELDVYHLAIIKSLANNFQGVAYTGVTHLMKFIGMSTEQSTTKTRTNESLLRLQEMGHIEIFEDVVMESKVKELKHANNYFIKPTGKEEEWGFAKVFATYLNMIGNIFYTVSNAPISYISI